MANKRVAFIYIGELNKQPRLMYQIETLLKNNFDITLFLCNENDYEMDIDNNNYKIVNNLIKYNRCKILTFIKQLQYIFITFRKILKDDFDIIICLGLNVLLTGVFIKIWEKEKIIIFDSFELFVERESGIKKIIWKIVQKMSLPFCNYIIHAGYLRRDYFLNKHSLSGHNHIVIANYPKKSISFERKKPNKIVSIIYIGVISESRNISEILNAFIYIKNKFNLTLIGYGNPKYLKNLQLITIKNENINIVPPVPFNKINEIIEKHDIGLAFYKNTNLNNYYCSPNKIYQYLHSGLPVITNDYPGLKEILEDNKIGICLNTIDTDNISNAISTIVNGKYYKNITDDIVDKYSWETQENKYLNLFNKK